MDGLHSTPAFRLGRRRGLRSRTASCLDVHAMSNRRQDESFPSARPPEQVVGVQVGAAGRNSWPRFHSQRAPEEKTQVLFTRHKPPCLWTSNLSTLAFSSWDPVTTSTLYVAMAQTHDVQFQQPLSSSHAQLCGGIFAFPTPE